MVVSGWLPEKHTADDLFCQSSSHSRGPPFCPATCLQAPWALAGSDSQASLGQGQRQGRDEGTQAQAPAHAYHEGSPFTNVLALYASRVGTGVEARAGAGGGVGTGVARLRAGAEAEEGAVTGVVVGPERVARKGAWAGAGVLRMAGVGGRGSRKGQKRGSLSPAYSGSNPALDAAYAAAVHTLQKVRN